MKREELNTLLTEWEQFKKANWYHSDAIDVEKYLMEKFAEIKAQSLPPAEGAEEILEKLEAYYDFKFHWVEKDRIIRAMTEFATLHAQRLAGKMVEEKLIEFGNMIRDEPNGDIPALAEYFMRTINLKSSER